MSTNPTNEHREQAREIVEIQNLAKRLQCTCVGERADHHAQCPVKVGAEIIAVIKSLIPVAPARNLRTTRDVAWLLVYDFEMIDCRCDGSVLTAGAKANLENRIASALSSRDAEVREVLEGLVRWSTCAGGGEPVVRHWCNHDHWCGDECRAATILYAKLQPLQSENPGDTVRE